MPYDPAELPDGESFPSPVGTELPRTNESIQSVQPSIPAQPVPDLAPKPIPSVPSPEPVSSTKVPQAQGLPSLKLGHQDPYPEESREELLERLESYLAEHAEALTDRHYEWIMDKAHKAEDSEGVLKMLSYSAKVVRNGAAIAGASA